MPLHLTCSFLFELMNSFYFTFSETSHDALQNEIVLKENEILWKVYFLSFFFSRRQCQNLSGSRKLAVL